MRRSKVKRRELSPEIRNNIYLASGSTHPELAEGIADGMGVDLGPMDLKTFPNTERYIRFLDTVRGKHVFAIQTMAAVDGGSVNDSLVELMIMTDAAKRASASAITVVAPYLAYSRQDRKAKGREPISAATVIRALQSAGADRIVSVDMHSPQTQATFNGPFDHLTAEPIIVSKLKKIVGTNHDEFVVVSPDGGRAKAAEFYAGELEVDVVHMPKSRDRNDSSKIKRPEFMDGVDGRTTLLVDDMIDTAGTLESASEALMNSGALRVIVGATHGIFSDPALERLRDSPIDKIIVTDTLPLDDAKEALGDRLKVLSSARLIARALGEIAAQGSVSEIFDDRNYQ